MTGNFALVFQPCLYSRRRTEAAVLSLVNKKAKPQSPAGRTHTHTPAGRAAPCGVRGGSGTAVCLPVTALSFMKSQSTVAAAASVQRDSRHEVSACRDTPSCAKKLRPSLRKGASCALWQHTYELHDGRQRLSLCETSNTGKLRCFIY